MIHDEKAQSGVTGIKFLCVFSVALFLFFIPCPKSEASDKLTITYPLPGAVFPWNFRIPLFTWEDNSEATSWQIGYQSAKMTGPAVFHTAVNQWAPSAEEWSAMQRHSLESDLTVTVDGLLSKQTVSSGQVTIRSSADPVGAPVFFREVPLPVKFSLHHLDLIQWKLGWTDSNRQPAIVMEKLTACANCHSFDRDGTVMGMDTDFKGDKGAYILADIEKDVSLLEENVISWSHVEPVPGTRTFGLFATISPNGRYIASTINDLAIYIMLDDLTSSQLFFPVTGQIAYFDRVKKKFSVLPGASDKDFVQTNPVFHPDGNSLVFARASTLDKSVPARDFVDRKQFFTYDLYRLPFPNPEGIAPQKVKGASENGMSNYFAKFSPDGKWLVFTQSQGFMIIQPDAQLVIIPAKGGTPRVMTCNFPGVMNSWHSFSPNGRWLVFSAKSDGPYTKLWLTHIDEHGQDSVPVLLKDFTQHNRAANLPEFVNIDRGKIHRITNSLPR